MEIDLNHATGEAEKNACGSGGEYDKGGKGGSCVCCLSTSTSSCSSNAASASASSSSCSISTSSSIYMELWHACAGPLISLPKKGNLVVYFPQGHLEQSYSSPFPPVEMPTFDLPSQILCRVVDVHLLANKDDDEVYTQLTLLPVPEVHKQGSLVGRAIDLSRLHGYNDLLTELERLFSMEGLLRDPNHGWHILYTDSENNMMVLGDDPWHEFVQAVTKIHIYTQEEVEKLTVGMSSDDTESCLEEAPNVTDV
ncbi:UNVERIFIED_CONTAM: Auxin response factor 4 [Sesamum calycinum]|uniref:Auxin response factor 4 n=1 Tax=Sesamum calycinum TaxID=2727403 RepID=A0AAW2SEN3_9LAMI